MQNRTIYKIEDEVHAEIYRGEYNSFDEALNELKLIAAIPWDKEPNRCPCTSWEKCERNYQIVEYDKTKIPWSELRRIDIVRISANVVKWD